MIKTLEATLKYMQDNELPCSEVKLAIYLLDNNRCDNCEFMKGCAKSQVGGKGKKCEWYPSRFKPSIT